MQIGSSCQEAMIYRSAGWGGVQAAFDHAHSFCILNAAGSDERDILGSWSESVFLYNKNQSNWQLHGKVIFHFT